MRAKLLPLLAMTGIAGCLRQVPAPQSAKGWAAKPPAVASIPLNPGDDAMAVALLRRSMDVYGNLETFRAESEKTYGSQQVKSVLTYSHPNRFRLVVSPSPGVSMTTISDGSMTIEYDSKSGLDPRLESAPAKIGQADSMQMTHPFYGGTLLYQFFGGSADYNRLVDTGKGPVTLGSEETDGGEKARVVKFVSRMTYGHVQLAIGETTGYVYRIVCDNEPLKKTITSPKALEQIQRDAGSKSTDGSGLAATALVTVVKSGHFDTTETFSNLSSPKSIEEATFACQAPSNSTPVNLDAEAGQPQPPVPLGKPAPDFAVKDLNGVPIRLADLKGHPVMLDFWATWCGPCVASLPHTQAIYNKGKAIGLQVLAVSGEELPPVAAFIKKNRYTFRTAIDKDSRTMGTYNARVIPTTVVIDKDGNLAAYIVGGNKGDEIEDALRKVGVNL